MLSVLSLCSLYPVLSVLCALCTLCSLHTQPSLTQVFAGMAPQAAVTPPLNSSRNRDVSRWSPIQLDQYHWSSTPIVGQTPLEGALTLTTVAPICASHPQLYCAIFASQPHHSCAHLCLSPSALLRPSVLLTLSCIALSAPVTQIAHLQMLLLFIYCPHLYLSCSLIVLDLCRSMSIYVSMLIYANLRLYAVSDCAVLTVLSPTVLF